MSGTADMEVIHPTSDPVVQENITPDEVSSLPPASKSSLGTPPPIQQELRDTYAPPMPVSADPSVPDPTSLPPSPARVSVDLDDVPGSRKPELGADDADTPELDDTSDPVPSLNVKALQSSSSGLFTPGAGSVPDSPKEQIEAENASHQEDFVGVEQQSITAPLLDAPDLDTLARHPLVDSSTNEDDSLENTKPPSTSETGVTLSPSASHPSFAKTDSSEPHQYPIQSNATPPLLHGYPSGSTVVMTRKMSDHILHSDPYPYSLSTPGMQFTEPESIIPTGLQREPQDVSNILVSTKDTDVPSQDGLTSLDDTNRRHSSPLPDEVSSRKVSEPLREEPAVDAREATEHEGDAGVETPFLTQETRQHDSEKDAPDVTDQNADLGGEVHPEIASTSALAQRKDSAKEVEEVDPFTLMGNGSVPAPSPLHERTSEDENKAVAKIQVNE